jgi:hypothetical protein
MPWCDRGDIGAQIAIIVNAASCAASTGEQEAADQAPDRRWYPIEVAVGVANARPDWALAWATVRSYGERSVGQVPRASEKSCGRRCAQRQARPRGRKPSRESDQGAWLVRPRRSPRRRARKQLAARRAWPRFGRVEPRRCQAAVIAGRRWRRRACSAARLLDHEMQALEKAYSFRSSQSETTPARRPVLRTWAARRRSASVACDPCPGSGGQRSGSGGQRSIARKQRAFAGGGRSRFRPV